MDIKYWLKSEGYLIRSIDSWSAGESLVIGDIRLNSGAYFCIAPHTSAAANEPGVGGTWATYWKALAEVTSTDAATHFTADDTTPYIRLVDGSDNDLAIRLNAGVLEIYDNGASALLAALTMSTMALSLSGALAVSGALSAPSAALSGPLKSTVLSKTASYEILDTDPDIVVVGAIGAHSTFTLPTAADNKGRVITIIIDGEPGAYNVVVDGEGAETINGAATKTNSVIYSYLRLLCNGVGWDIIGSGGTWA